MENLIYRILFSYTAFGGPLYKFYASWSSEECIVNYEIESVYPDRKEKGSLDKSNSLLFLKLYDNLINNRDEASVDPEKVFEFIYDVPTCQLLISEGLRNFELDEWQTLNELYDMKPLYDMILICDNKANFLEE